MAMHTTYFASELLQRFRSRLRQRLAGFATEQPAPVRLQRRACPQVRRLEPRLVLNATAELNSLGQLWVMGTDAAESVNLEVRSDGGISLREGTRVIPIELEPSGSTDVLDPSQVNQITFDLGGGDDILDLQLPEAVDVQVLRGAGDDRVLLRFVGNPAVGDAIQVDAETITFAKPSLPIARVGADHLDLRGEVLFGLPGAASRIELGGGSLRVDGRLLLTGNVAIVGTGQVDLSDATLSANTAMTSLRVDLQAIPGSDLLLGGADDSGGQQVEDLAVVSANSVTIAPSPFSIAGELRIENVSGPTRFDAPLEAAAITVATNGPITVSDSVRSDGGSIVLVSKDSLTIFGDLDTTPANAEQINLSGRAVQLVDARITTAGGLVNVAGPTQISGDVRIDSGDAQAAASGGRVEFFGTVAGTADAVADTLRVDARAMTLDGAVRFQAPIGASPETPAATDLNGLEVLAGQIEVDSIGVSQGNVNLSADVITLLGSQIRTSVSGDIDVDGDLLLPTGDTTITAAGLARFHSLVKSQAGSRDLLVSAGSDALFDGQVLVARNFQVATGALARFLDTVETLDGQINVVARDITITDLSVNDDGDDRKGDPEFIARGTNGRIDLQAARTIHLLDDVQLMSEKITVISHLNRDSDPVTGELIPETREMPVLPDLDGLKATGDMRAVYLQAETVVLGQRVEINTGASQGVARVFSPRPPDPNPRVIDPVTGDPVSPPLNLTYQPAFFHPDSVRTNVLEQALVNDATGVLTLDIGQPGERGLTIDLDWGAPNESDVGLSGQPDRYQQINGLSADSAVLVGLDGIKPVVQTPPAGAPPLLTVAHYYTQANIVDSRGNGRPSATAPLEVRFAVRHHESILILATNIQQGESVEEKIPGGVVSSTDNPNTNRGTLPDVPSPAGVSGLENGVATFVIPSLTIPVAFIPVRDVIPQFEVREVVVRGETSIALSQTSFQSEESSSFSVVSRRDYFRIRVLSPQPGGQDLAPPVELPDDILEGDRLKELFSQLPDGRYELEYVLGDATSRSVWQVDVRDGLPTIPDEELDENVLKLKRLQQAPTEDAPPAEEADREAVPAPPPQAAAPGAGAELPVEDGDQRRDAALPPLAAGLALASALQRRSAARRRLSQASRLAARCQSRLADKPAHLT